MNFNKQSEKKDVSESETGRICSSLLRPSPVLVSLLRPAPFCSSMTLFYLRPFICGTSRSFIDVCLAGAALLKKYWLLRNFVCFWRFNEERLLLQRNHKVQNHPFSLKLVNKSLFLRYNTGEICLYYYSKECLRACTMLVNLSIIYFQL
jgi:hypothetical protein